MPPVITHIFAGIPDSLPDELFESILKNEAVHIERIVSRGHISAEDHWYDQDWDEWILLLKGQGRLLFDDTEIPVTLLPGDYCLIPAHVRHRVVWTAPDQDTIWLAIHLKTGT
ncbi:MAG: cupin domain-containing protein [Gammaproteobacteria bacterium]